MRRRVLGILFAALFIVMVGFAMLFPVEPYYVRTFGATSRTMGWLIASFSLAQFVFSPMWGRLSDRMGRKPVLMMGLAGYAVSMALFGLARSIPALFVTRTLAGVLSSATLPTALAIIADTTTEEDRARGMGVVGAAFGLGVIFGPFVGGVLGEINIRLPFAAAAALSLVTLALVGWMLPESLRRDGRETAQAAGGSRWAAIRGEAAILYLVGFLVTFSLAGLETAFPFLANDRFGLTQRSVGYIYAVMGLVGAAVQGGLVGRMKRAVGEYGMILGGLLTSGAGMAGLAVAPSPAIATAAISLFAAGHGLIRPALTSLVSQRARVGHGLAIGALSSMDSLGRILGPVAGGTLYVTRELLPFAAGSAINALAFLGLLVLPLARPVALLAGSRGGQTPTESK